MKWLYPKTWRRRKRQKVSRRRILWLIPFTMALAWMSGELGKYWIFQYANYEVNESLGALSKPVKARHTSIVTIDPDDYRTFFGARSPLNPKALQNTICAVLSQRPAVLVVDFDTSDPSFRQLQIPETPTRIVWARSLYRFREKTYTGSVLGRASGSESQGFAVSPADRDGTIRSFPREVLLDGKYFATVHWRAVQEFHALKNTSPAPAWVHLEKHQPELEVGRLGTNFEFDQYPIREFTPSENSCREIGRVAPNHDFANRIVLLGGNYQFSDIHRSAFEDTWGVEMLASAIEAELSGHGVKHYPYLWKFLLKLILAALIGLLFHFLFATPATVITLAGLGLIVTLGNILAVYLGGYEGMVIPFVLGVVIEQLINVVEQAQHAQRELEELAHVKVAQIEHDN